MSGHSLVEVSPVLDYHEVAAIRLEMPCVRHTPGTLDASFLITSYPSCLGAGNRSDPMTSPYGISCNTRIGTVESQLCNMVIAFVDKMKLKRPPLHTLHDIMAGGQPLNRPST